MTLDIEVTDLRLRYGDVTARTTWASPSEAAGSTGCSAATAPARPACCRCWPGSASRRAARCGSTASRCSRTPRITRQVCLIRETGDTGDRDDRVRYALWTAARLRPGWDAGYADALVERFEIPRHKKLRELSLGQQSALGMIFGLATRAPVTPARSSSRPT
jgi:ABC-2 type transport system ATP-binding protein